MLEHTITALLIVIAVIHLLPLAGIVGVAQLQKLYCIKITDPNLVILLRHRAMLFGILGIFFTYAAFVPALQVIAFIAAAASISSFFYLAYSVGGYNQSLAKVVTADILAAVCLSIASILYVIKTLT